MSDGVVLYTTQWCPFCVRAKQLLDQLGVPYTEHRVDREPALRSEMMKKSGGRHTVPQVFIGNRHVGGCDETVAAHRAGQLAVWLKEVGIHV
ncbi:MAG: glutaredoxin 3 [Gammaproteobacteria bacterium]|nr:glutaredoxin 3 [Gammaproteobacteria bacterium]